MGVTWNHRYIIARKSTGTCFKSNYDISVGIVGNLTGQKTTKRTTFSSIALRIHQLVFFIFVKIIFINISVHVWNLFIFETSWKIYSRQNKFVMLIFWPAFCAAVFNWTTCTNEHTPCTRFFTPRGLQSGGSVQTPEYELIFETFFLFSNMKLIQILVKYKRYKYTNYKFSY